MIQREAVLAVLLVRRHAGLHEERHSLGLVIADGLKERVGRELVADAAELALERGRVRASSATGRAPPPPPPNP